MTATSPRKSFRDHLPSIGIPRPRPMRRSTFYVLFWGGLAIATGAASLAAFTHLASEVDAANYVDSQPVPVVYIDEGTNSAPSADAPAPGIDPAALPDLSAAFGGAVVEAVAPAPVAEAAPVGDAESTVEYVGESGTGAATEAVAPAPAADIHSTWTTSYGSQAALDACDGSLVVQPYGNVVPVGAIHNYCGGDGIPKESGYLIQVDGITYRSLGVAAALNFFEDDTLDIPQVGDFQIQTCWPDKTQMAFIAFERV